MSNKINKTTKVYLKKIASTAAYELVPIVGLIFAMFIEFAHIANTSWRQLFLYGSDSLTLPIIREAFAHKEHFLWVFSSQLNWFPEGVFYWLSSIFTVSIRASLLLNAIINVLVFYVLVRVIVGYVSDRSRLSKQIVALLCSLLLVMYFLLETQSKLAYQDYPTFYLFTTYYYGVIVTGLLQLCFILKQIKARTFTFKNNAALMLLTLVLVALTVASDPLYIIQMAVPIAATVGIIWVLRIISWRQLVFIELPQLAGVLAGLLARVFLGPLFSESFYTHVSFSFSNFQIAFFSLLTNLTTTWQSAGTVVRIYITVFVYFIGLFAVLFTINAKLKGKRYNKNPLALFILLFAVMEPIVLMACLTLSNDLMQRYTIVAVIVPLLSIPVLLIETKQIADAINKYGSKIMTSVVLLLVVAGAMFIPSGAKLLSSNYPSELCLESSLNYKPINGVGDYWDSRSLDVYNTYNERVLQVNPDLSVFAWLNNLAAYQNMKFNFFIISKTLPSSQNLSLSDLAKLGSPSKIYNCPTMHIYFYNTGTKGYLKLNSIIQSTLNGAIKTRQLNSKLMLY